MCPQTDGAGTGRYERNFAARLVVVAMAKENQTFSKLPLIAVVRLSQIHFRKIRRSVPCARKCAPFDPSAFFIH